MPVHRNRSAQIALLAGELFLLNVAFFLAAFLRFRDLPLLDTVYYDYYLQLWIISNLLWLLLSLLFKTHAIGLILQPRQSLSKSINVWLSHLFLVLLLLVSTQKGSEYSRLFFIYFYLFSFFTVLPWRFFYLRLLRGLRQQKRLRRPVLVVGCGDGLRNLVQTLKQPELGLEPQQVFSEEGWEGSRPLKDLWAYRPDDGVEELFLSLEPGDERFAQFYKYAEKHLLRLRYVPNLGLPPVQHLKLEFFQDLPVLSFVKEPLAYSHNRILKRSFDLILTSLLILLTYPTVMPLLYLGNKLFLPGPFLFKQVRSGYRGETFTIKKIRSLKAGPGRADGQVSNHDERLNAWGRFLRRSHLDELPQFAQVLKGEMSLVGPRPHMLQHTEEYRSLIQKYMLRHLAKPGITGLSQVRGLKGEHALPSMQERVKTDVYYLENWSLLLDLSIILRTPLSL